MVTEVHSAGELDKDGAESEQLAERRLARQLRQQAVLARLGHSAIAATTVWELMQAATFSIGDALEIDYCEVLEVVDGGMNFRVRSVLGGATALGALVPAADATHAAYVLETRLPVLVAQLQEETRFRPALSLRDAKVVSSISVLIHGRNRPFGVLGAHSSRSREFTPEDISFLEAVASLLAASLDRARADEASQRSQASFRALIETAPDFVLVQREGVVVWVNPSLMRFFGMSRDELVGRPFDDLLPAEERGLMHDYITEARTDGIRSLPFEGRLLRRDGSIGYVEWVGIRLDFEGELAWVGLGRDLTERRRLQARMAITDRLVAVGTLAAGVAHELNNPLTYVLGNLEVMTRRLEAMCEARPVATEASSDLSDLKLAATEALDGARRMRQIVSDLRGISRADDRAGDAVDLSEVVRAAVNLTRAESRRRARLEVEVAPTPPVLGNAARLGQVLVNLIVNAAQSITPGNPDEHTIRVEARELDQDWVELDVADSGAGIPPEVLPRIFEPFFSTKPVGVGTGLGLWICHNVVCAVGGRIEVESNLGRGSVFRVFLPVARGEPASEVSEAMRAPSPSERRRVLVVDDEPQVGAVIQRALAVHEVLVVEDAEEALRLLRGGARFDVIICDMLMPGMTGPELLEHVRAELPRQAERFLFVSGISGEGAVPEHQGVAVLAKPFNIDRLFAEVERIAQGPR